MCPAQLLPPPGPTTPSQANQHPKPFSTSYPSEIIQHEISKEDLVLIKNESCSRRNFALHQAEKMFEKGEWIGSNCEGRKGKRKLDPVRIERISRQQPLSCGHWKEKRSMRMPGKSVKKLLTRG